MFFPASGRSTWRSRMPARKKTFQSGTVVLVGKPNVGKSTLLNRLVARKISITSPKMQTTRRRILGIKTTQDSQIVFVDTPGLSTPRHLLGKAMVRHAQEALADADVVLFLVQATDPEPEEEDRRASRMLQGGLRGRKPAPPLFLVINKIDAIKDKQLLLPIIEAYSGLGSFHEVFPVSALDGENVDALDREIKKALPEGPPYYPLGVASPEDERFRIAEIVREKVLDLVHQEVPHGVAVSVEEIRPGRGGQTLYVRGTVYVQRETHKGILVGAGGKMLKRIGSLARREIEGERGQPVFLDLWVKVREGWQDREEMLRIFGYT